MKQLGFVAVFLLAACGSDASDAGGEPSACAVGAAGCPCTAGGGCDPGLVCGADDTCVGPGEEGEPGGGGEGDACVERLYDAYFEGGGRDCGEDGIYTAECLPGDLCLDPAAARCVVIHSGLDGVVCSGPYDAYFEAGGRNCGEDGIYVAECLPGDVCIDPALGSCGPVWSDGSPACGETYDGYFEAGGPNCGDDGIYTAECLPGDVCVDEQTSSCRFVRSSDPDVCPDETYDAYFEAGGPNCGEDGIYVAECEPGDVCLDPALGTCD